MKEENVEGVFYSEDGAAQASLDQEKAAAIDLLRQSEIFSVTALNKDKSSVQHISFILDEDEFVPFLTYTAVRAICGLAKAMDKPPEEALRFVAMIIKDGKIGEVPDELG